MPATSNRTLTRNRKMEIGALPVLNEAVRMLRNSMGKWTK
jgi:hypothetical protein